MRKGVVRLGSIKDEGNMIQDEKNMIQDKGNMNSENWRKIQDFKKVKIGELMETKKNKMMGYDIDLLHEFACLCMKCGLEPKDLVDLKKDMKLCYDFVSSQMNQDFKRNVETYLNIENYLKSC